jgi:putative metallohydrolase (TIGR04338 family)
MTPPAPPSPTSTSARLPRDAQRRRVYLAETPLPSSPLPGLDACARFVDRVVGSLWWELRFPDRHLGAVPRLRPGNGARQAFYREEPTGPTITLPRRYRTKGVVLHELVHWALGLDSGLPAHGRTFARVLLDATSEYCGDARAAELAASYRAQRVHVGKPARCGPDGRLRYGWDERLRLGRGRVVTVAHRVDGEVCSVTGRFDGYERGSSIVPVHGTDGTVARVRTADVYDVTYPRQETAHG